jgi:phage protein D
MPRLIDGLTTVRTPRINACLNDVTVDSVMRLDVNLSGSCKSSRFELTVSTLGLRLPLWLLQLPTTPVTVSISVSDDDNNTNSSILQGLADSVAYDPINQVARIEGRDYSAVLVSSSYQGSYCNQTSSEIASQIAIRHGFTPIITVTSKLVGSYQCDGYNQVLLNAHSHVLTEWDLLSDLATKEGFELFVTGTNLVFAPLASLQVNYITLALSDIKSIRLHQECSLSGQNTVTVKSWNSWLGQALCYADGQTTDQSVTNPLALNCDAGIEIALVKPNLSSQGVQQIAQNYAARLQQQSTSVEIVIPGEVSLQPFDIVSITGIGDGFESDYLVRSVRRQFSPTAGFVDFIRGVPASSSITPSNTSLSNG